ncbi:methyl-accepting chemotaxis protein [Mastigocoleus testarum]|uniref:Chemotaxis protein n=1 Tax=Mastigocoleus testarum BC008 TaxID=371196 RepID=A0A0V7ZPX8_9CYAN|nr:methyl-accepting chemotaxis protein [Mastigocoleus testarum]KST66552.1 chemotaxis protein [Mastigocoleus testarum BC008]
MFNKADDLKNGNTGREVSSTSSGKLTKAQAKLNAISSNSNVENRSSLNRPGKIFQGISWGRKATILAVAFGTLPILGMGVFAYKLTDKGIRDKIHKIQETKATGLADKVNLFMSERVREVQLWSTLPTFRNPNNASSLLNKFGENSRFYSNIAIFNLKGNVIAQSQKNKLSNESNFEYFKYITKTGKTQISQPEKSKDNSTYNIYIGAPIKDAATGKVLYIIRAQMPVASIDDEIVKDYAGQGQEYNLVDSSQTIFLSAEKQYIGKKLITEYKEIPSLLNPDRVETFITDRASNNRKELVSYIPSSKLSGLEWSILLSRDKEAAFEPQRSLWLQMLLGTILMSTAVMILSTLLVKRATRPIVSAAAAVAKLGEGKLDTRLEVSGEDEIGVLGANINLMAKQLQTLIQEKELDSTTAKLLADIVLQTRKSLTTEDILKTIVEETRQALKTDRVVVYIFNPETWDGTVASESVNPKFVPIAGQKIDDPCFRERQIKNYQQGRVRAIEDIYEDPALKKADCYVQTLERFAVRANLVAPIITESKLLGLLIAHHCQSPRPWEKSEIDLFEQIAVQTGYALEQAKLLEKLERSQISAESQSHEERRQKEKLELQLVELLSEVEGAASGDLTVRADVTPGDIGTVADFFNSIVESLREIVTQVKDTATQVNTAIGSNEGAIRELAEEALSQTTEINNTLDAVDNMNQSMQQVAQSAQEAASVAKNASQTATQSGEAMDLTVQSIVHLRQTVGDTAKKVKRLGESMQQITRVVALINQISMQTNLLAINAGIEAARAGEEGQGFAVVAEEVGELAARSAGATKEIEQIVENIQRETSDLAEAMELGTAQVVEGTRVVEHAKYSLNQILTVSQQIDSLVNSISQATTSQVEISQTVSQLMKQIASVSERTSTSSNQVRQSLQQTVKISQKLQKTVGTFKVN